MTAHAMKGDRERCLECGMDEYLAKPLRASELFQLLDKIPQRSSSKHTGKDRQRTETDTLATLQ